MKYIVWQKIFEKSVKIGYILLTAILIFGQNIFAQSYKEIKIMSYNVENLFDIYDDPKTKDNEFLPNSMRGWNYNRYMQKLRNIVKVIVAAGEWDLPVLIGLCEIENYKVLSDLIYKTGLKNLNYSIVHYDSPDARGIDVGLLYRSDEFRLINSHPIRLVMPDTNSITRDILYASGQLSNGDTLHVFVNHFPSRLGGELESEPKRLAAAGRLRMAVDSIFAISRDSKIVILGDFNDMPDNRSMLEILKAHPLPKDENNRQNGELYNLTYSIYMDEAKGTYKYKGEWNMLDQMIVSETLLNKNSSIQVSKLEAEIFAPEWLLERDKKHGFCPYRTYVGFKYNGGYSDHLPIVITLKLNHYAKKRAPKNR